LSNASCDLGKLEPQCVGGGRISIQPLGGLLGIIGPGDVRDRFYDVPCKRASLVADDKSGDFG
jgi:hypothetical protein